MQKGYREILNSGKEYYEIRLESIGGLGANLCGKMLGELGLKYLGVNSSNFSSYGSEKTGTPVKGFIRFCNNEKEIRLHSPVINPDLLVVFHQALLEDDSVWKGCSSNTNILIALEQAQRIPPIAAYQKIYGIEAQRIAMETHSRINVVMLGAILKVMGVDSIEAGEKICQDTLGKKYPASLQSNLEGMRRGYEEVKQLTWNMQKEERASKEGRKENIHGIDNRIKNPETDLEQPKWGYLTAPIGGINPNVGNSIISDLSPSRQRYIPLFIKERCINCGLCFSACPDMVFQFVKGEYKGRNMMINQGLDYYHCKGCLRCVDVCPVNALVRGVESEHEKKEHFMPNQELLRMPKYYEKAGADGYITSESYLTEQRMEGGEV